ncbi:MAG: hypothetical protein D3910_21105, partial [Candidatus Electrothrix sp. ATG2]|nr:hypothetical protein [Candidatus Electrothrix sp. ATG2]
MPLPLYSTLKDFTPCLSSRDAHAGLLFERFYDQFKLPDYLIDNDSHASWLKNNFHRKAGNAELLEQAVQRQKELIHSLGGKTVVFETEYRFVTGMGNPHPVENGMAWHPVWGAPYLPGAAVKGLVRTWVEEWEEKDCQKLLEWEKKMLQWFGSVSKEPEDNNVRTGD